MGMGSHQSPHFVKLLWQLVTSTIFVHSQHLIARELPVLFDFNHGVPPFYAACPFDDVSRGSVSCLLNASFEKQYPQCHNLIFYAKIDDHSIRRGNMGWILTQSRHSVASLVSLDLSYWAMCSALYRLTRMAFQMASKAGACFCHLWYILNNRS